MTEQIKISIEKEYPELTGTPITNPDCRAYMAVAKDILEQYYAQLQEYFSDLDVKSASGTLDGVATEDYNKVKRILSVVEAVLSNFEKNVFYGRFGDNMLRIFNLSEASYGKEIEYILHGEPSKEDLEKELTRRGVEKLFRVIGIPETVLVKSIEYARQQLFLENSLDGKLLAEEQAANGVLESSELVEKLSFNNLIEANLNHQCIRMDYVQEKTMNYDSYRPLIIDLERTRKILDGSLDERFANIPPQELDRRNVITRDLYVTLFKLSSTAGILSVKNFLANPSSYVPFDGGIDKETKF